MQEKMFKCFDPLLKFIILLNRDENIDIPWKKKFLKLNLNELNVNLFSCKEITIHF